MGEISMPIPARGFSRGRRTMLRLREKKGGERKSPLLGGWVREVVAQTNFRKIKDEVSVLRPPSSWPSPPGRRNGGGTFLVLRRRVRPIQSREFSEKRRTILLLLGEKAGMRESVQTNFFPVGRWMGRRKDVLNGARASARFNVRTGEGVGNFLSVLVCVR